MTVLNALVTYDLEPNIIGVVLKSYLTEDPYGGVFGHIDAAGNDITSPSSTAFNSIYPWSQIADQTIDSQLMVKIPKFYYKVGTIASGTNAGKKAWWVSDIEAPGFSIHPAFMKSGVELDNYWMGKYQGSVASSKLRSVAGVVPTGGLTVAQMAAAGTARNVSGITGFMAASIWQWSAIQFLFLVEKKSLDSKNASGNGYYGNSVVSVSDANVITANYRGLLGMWGNILQWANGLTQGASPARRIKIWDELGNKSYVDTGRNTIRDDDPGSGISLETPLTYFSGGTPDMSAMFMVSSFTPLDGDNKITPEKTSTGAATLPVRTYYACMGGQWQPTTPSSPENSGLFTLNFVSFNNSFPTSAGVGTRLAKE